MSSEGCNCRRASSRLFLILATSVGSAFVAADLRFSDTNVQLCPMCVDRVLSCKIQNSIISFCIGNAGLVNIGQYGIEEAQNYVPGTSGSIKRETKNVDDNEQILDI
jgi:hypothetical protein